MKCGLYRLLYFSSGDMSMAVISNGERFPRFINSDSMTYPFRLGEEVGRPGAISMNFYCNLTLYTNISYSSGHKFFHVFYLNEFNTYEIYKEIEILDYDGRGRI